MRDRSPHLNDHGGPDVTGGAGRRRGMRRGAAVALAAMATATAFAVPAGSASGDQPPRPNPNTYVFQFENNNSGMVARFCVRNSDMSFPETDCTENVPTRQSASRNTGTAPRGAEAYSLGSDRMEQVNVDFAKCVDQFCTFEVVGTTNTNFVLQQR